MKLLVTAFLFFVPALSQADCHTSALSRHAACQAACSDGDYVCRQLCKTAYTENARDCAPLPAFLTPASMPVPNGCLHSGEACGTPNDCCSHGCDEEMYVCY